VSAANPSFAGARHSAYFFSSEHFDSAARTPQKGGEMGWILETNRSMNRAMEGMGGKIVSTYRLFEKELG